MVNLVQDWFRYAGKILNLNFLQYLTVDIFLKPYASVGERCGVCDDILACSWF